MYHVTVFLHPRAVSMGLLDGPAVKVDTFDIDDPAIHSTLDLAWVICNSDPVDMLAPEQYRPIVEQYRANRHRSLSMGDYVMLSQGDHHRIFEVADCGWEPVRDKLAAGFVSVKDQGIIHDPRLARLMQTMAELDRQVIADCLEGE